MKIELAVKDKFKLIDELDLLKMRWKLAQPFEKGGQGFSAEECRRAEAGYRKFLKLVLLYPEKDFVPTRLIDEMWHLHVLDTTKYHEMCEEIFGEYLHHAPVYDEIEESHDQMFAETKSLYEQTFGTALVGEMAFSNSQSSSRSSRSS